MMNWEMSQAIDANHLWLAGHWWHGMLWPTVVFPLSWSSYGENQYGSYCQGLALENGAGPWAVDVRELVIYGHLPSSMAVPDPLPPCEIPSTMVIEEVYDGMSCLSIPSIDSFSSTDGDEDGYVMVNEPE